MPDDNPSEGVEQRPVEERPVVKPIEPPAPPNDPASPPAQGISNNSVQDAVHAIEDRVKRAEWLMIGLTAGIVLLTLGLVIVGILQWRAMSGQLTEMKSGGKDTHDLAIAAKAQADNMGSALEKTDALIKTATNQAVATNELAKSAQEQVGVMGNQLKIARDTFKVVNRPYLGNEASVKFSRPAGPNLPEVIFEHPADIATAMSISLEIKNFGSVPARNVATDWGVFVEGVKLPGDAKLKNGPVTIYPGRFFYLLAFLTGPAYRDVVKIGSARLAIRVTTQYDGPNDHYTECDEMLYSKSDAQFLELGECPPAPPPTKKKPN